MENRLYQAVVETMQDGLLMVDDHGTITAVNPAFTSMTGYSNRDLVGRRCTVLNCTGCEILGKGPGKLWCSLFAKGGVRNRRCEISAKGGHIVHVVKQAVVLYDEHGNPNCAVETLKDVSQLVNQEKEIQSLRATLEGHEESHGIIGHSRGILGLLDLVRNVGQSDAPVLIHGESGVGKELVARAVHECGNRAEGPFIKVNCSSLNENLLESELFGHVKGAFTGANRDRVGRFEAACGGSIFLDEIGDISPSIQVKLLRVLESKEIERVGDHKPVPVDARIITATNRDIEALTSRGDFRQDLFYRINVVPVRVPPLREHPEDIPLLAQYFIDRIAAHSGKPIAGLSPQALEVMIAYPWPGNVRELRNTIEYSFVLCPDSIIDLCHLPSRIASVQKGLSCPKPSPSNTLRTVLAESAMQTEREILRKALRDSGGNQAEAARLLGVSRVTVWKKMKKHGLSLKKELA